MMAHINNDIFPIYKSTQYMSSDAIFIDCACSMHPKIGLTFAYKLTIEQHANSVHIALISEFRHEFVGKSNKDGISHGI